MSVMPLLPALPWTFRNGAVLMTVHTAEESSNRFTVASAQATYYEKRADLNLPAHYFNVPFTDLEDIKTMLADTVRSQNERP